MTTKDEYVDISHGTKKCRELIKMYFTLKIPILMLGEPGVGKTSLWRAVAEELGINCLVIAPCNHDAIDIKLPYIKVQTRTVDGEVTEEKIAAYAIGEILPREGKWFILIDDITNVPPSMQASLYSLVNEGTIGSYSIPDGSYIGAAGNRTIDRCNASELSAALKNRFAVMNVTTNNKEWLNEFGYKNNTHPAVIGFVMQNMGQADPFSDGFDATDPCGGFTARSLEKLSDLLNGYDSKISAMDRTEYAPIFKGIIGRNKGHAFTDYFDMYIRNIDIQDILDGKPFDKEKIEYSELINIITTLVPLVNKQNINNYADFILTFSDDIASLSIQELGKKDRKLVERCKKLEKFFLENYQHGII